MSYSSRQGCNRRHCPHCNGALEIPWRDTLAVINRCLAARKG